MGLSPDAAGRGAAGDNVLHCESESSQFELAQVPDLMCHLLRVI